MSTPFERRSQVAHDPWTCPHDGLPANIITESEDVRRCRDGHFVIRDEGRAAHAQAEGGVR